MSEYHKNVTIRLDLCERIIRQAMNFFKEKGIKAVTMDEIASSLGISKRTLYEAFSDKETLLKACIRYRQQESSVVMREIYSTSENVMEVILRVIQLSIEHFHSTNKLFFEDIKKYPKALEVMRNRDKEDLDATINFLKQGIEQGLFRSDVNFEIVNILVKEQMKLLISTDICSRYSFLEVYESIMFMYLRGISTHKGVQMLDKFMEDYRQRTKIDEK